MQQTFGGIGARALPDPGRAWPSIGSSSLPFLVSAALVAGTIYLGLGMEKDIRPKASAESRASGIGVRRPTECLFPDLGTVRDSEADDLALVRSLTILSRVNAQWHRRLVAYFTVDSLSIWTVISRRSSGYELCALTHAAGADRKVLLLAFYETRV